MYIYIIIVSAEMICKPAGKEVLALLGTINYEKCPEVAWTIINPRR